jgi:hypothetical protein
MKEPERIPLDPSTPKAKSVKTIPLNKLYVESIQNDTYIKDNEDSKKSTET